MSTPPEHRVEVHGGATENAVELSKARERIAELENLVKSLTESNSEASTLITEFIENTKSLESRLAASEEACAEMREACGMSTPWPIIDVLHTLANWCDHTGQIHDCDCNGWEVRDAGVKAARVIVERLTKALSTTAGTGYFAKCPKCGWEEER